MNFDEALGVAYKAWAPYSIPGGVRAVLDEAGGLTGVPEQNPGFWIAAKAVKQFVDACGRLPLAGNLPDMTADTESYIQLQALYKTRADGDCAAVQAHAAQIASAAGMKHDEEQVARFCRHAQEVELFRLRTYSEELDSPATELLQEEAMDEDSEVGWYVAMRAAQAFREKYGRWAGDCEDADVEQDQKLIVAEVTALAEAFGVTLEDVDKKAEELVRYGSAVLHATCSVVGGVAGQEAVKMLTGQFTPLNNTWIYNGLKGSAQALEL